MDLSQATLLSHINNVIDHLTPLWHQQIMKSLLVNNSSSLRRGHDCSLRLKLGFQVIDFINGSWQLLVDACISLSLNFIFLIQLFVISHQHLLTLIISTTLLLNIRGSISRLCIHGSRVNWYLIYDMVWDECLFNTLHRQWNMLNWNWIYHRRWCKYRFSQWGASVFSNLWVRN